MQTLRPCGTGGESSPAAEPKLKLKLLGAFEVTLRDKPLTGLRERQGERLLAYLALRRGRAVSSAALSGIFWPGTSSLDSRRSALVSLRRALGCEASRLETSRGSVSFDLNGVGVDVVAFEAAVTQQSDCALRYALSLYHGPLLEDWQEAWLDNERARLREAYLETLWAAGRRALETGDHGFAAACFRKYLRYCPAREQAWSHLMHTLGRSGERLAALDIYHKYRDFLHQRYELPPPAAITTLYYELREQSANNSSPLRDQAGVSPGAGMTEESIGGAMPLNSPFYIMRAADDKFQTAIARQDSIVLVKGACQTGKSSLLARGIHYARKRGASVVVTDVTTFTPKDTNSMEAVCLRLAECLAAGLDLEFSAQNDWNPLLSPGINLERYLHRRVMTAVSAPLVWGLDGLDALFGRSYSGEFFSMLRSWHEKRSFEPTRAWRRLTLAITCATEAHLYIKDLNKSPFNVGTRLALEDFTPEQVEAINRCYGLLLSPPETTRFYDLLGGHPYLTRRGFVELAQREAGDASEPDWFEVRAFEEGGPFGDHLRRMAKSVMEDAVLKQAVADTLRQGVCGEESFFRLRSGGVLGGANAAHARVRCRLYETYLRKLLT